MLTSTGEKILSALILLSLHDFSFRMTGFCCDRIGDRQLILEVLKEEKRPNEEQNSNKHDDELELELPTINVLHAKQFVNYLERNVPEDPTNESHRRIIKMLTDSIAFKEKSMLFKHSHDHTKHGLAKERDRQKQLEQRQLQLKQAGAVQMIADLLPRVGIASGAGRSVLLAVVPLVFSHSCSHCQVRLHACCLSWQTRCSTEDKRRS